MQTSEGRWLRQQQRGPNDHDETQSSLLRKKLSSWFCQKQWYIHVYHHTEKTADHLGSKKMDIDNITTATTWEFAAKQLHDISFLKFNSQL